MIPAPPVVEPPPAPPFKHEMTVDLLGENYILVSCSLNEQFYTGILLRCDASSLAENADDVLRKLAADDSGACRQRRYDQQKISSLCFRRTATNDDDNPFRLLQNLKPAKGVRRLDLGPTVRLRPVPIQRNQNGVHLCSRCQNECETTSSSSAATATRKSSSKNRCVVVAKSPPIVAKSVNSRRKRPSLQTIFDKILQRKKFKKSDFVGGQILPDLQQQHPTTNDCCKQIDNQPPYWKMKKNLTKQPAASVNNAAQPPIPKLKIKLSGSTSTAVTLTPTTTPAAEPTTTPTETTTTPTTTLAEPTTTPHFLRKDAVVWAKMRSYPYWPARIFDLQQNCACVVWAASLQYGYVDADVLEPFLENFKKRYNAKRNVSYQKAVADALARCQEQHGDDSAASSALLQRLPLAPSCRKFFDQYRRARQFRDAQQKILVKNEAIFGPRRDDYASDVVADADEPTTTTVVATAPKVVVKDEISSCRDDVATDRDDDMTPVVATASKVVVKREIPNHSDDYASDVVADHDPTASLVVAIPQKVVKKEVSSRDYARDIVADRNDVAADDDDSILRNVEKKAKMDEISEKTTKIENLNEFSVLPPKKLTMRTLSHDFSKKTSFKNRFLTCQNRSDLLKIKRPNMTNGPPFAQPRPKTPPTTPRLPEKKACVVETAPRPLPSVEKPRPREKVTSPRPQVAGKKTTIGGKIASPRPLSAKTPPKMPLKMTVKNLDVYKNRLPQSPPTPTSSSSQKPIFQPLSLKNLNFSIPKRSFCTPIATTTSASVPTPILKPVVSPAHSSSSSAGDQSPRLVIDEEAEPTPTPTQQQPQPQAPPTNKKPVADDFDNVLSKLREMNELCENSSSSCSSTVSR